MSSTANQPIAPLSPGSQYTDEQRQEVLAKYAVLGNLSRVSELVNIPVSTICHWKNKSEWWEPTLERIRNEKKDELDANLSNIIHSATEGLSERISIGDAYVDREGEVGFKPISGRDLATITGIIFDKRQLLRSAPTSIKAESTDARLNTLAEKVRELQAGQFVIEQDSEEKE